MRAPTVLALLLCGWLALAAARAGAAADIVVEATRRGGGVVEVACRARLDAPAALVWSTLTDYARLADFIPGLRSSRVLSRRGAVVVVEQSGEARLLWFRVPIDVTLVSTERPPHAIDARLLKGSLKRLEGAYRIAPQADGGVLLSWRGVVEAERLPPLLDKLLLRASIEQQFRGMVREIERRAALQRDAGAGALR